MSNLDLKRLLNILAALVEKSDTYLILPMHGARKGFQMYYAVGEYRRRLKIRLSEATQRASGLTRGLDDVA